MGKSNQWHLSKGFTVAHAISTAGLFASALVFVFNLDKSIAVNSNEIKNIKVEMARSQKSNHDMFNRIDKNVDKMSVKMDRLFELMHKAK